MAFALKTGVILAQGNFAQGKRQIERTQLLGTNFKNTEGNVIDTGCFVHFELNKMSPTLS